jgi:hypothetical protein
MNCTCGDKEMDNDIKYMEIVTWNKAMILMHGDKLTGTQKLIGLRSNGLHAEWRFTDRHGRISFSCTLADGCGCCRFKMINYSHPYRQSRVYVPVTAEQEARLFKKACEMADVEMGLYLSHTDISYFNEGKNGCAYGPNAIKYDKNGARFSFITGWNIWKMHKTKMICNEACANLGLEVWPGLLDVNNGKTGKIIDPAQLTPETFEYLARFYFDKEQA